MAGSSWDGDRYQDQFDALAASGADVHGEAAFVAALGPTTVLDAGCGTGRVGLELARRGVEVVGVDVDRSMLATARRLGPTLTWIEADLAGLDLGRTFDVVVMAGNVVLFTPPGTEGAVIERCAAHLAPGGALVAGFQLGGDRYDLERYDRDCRAAGLELAERYATWDRAPLPADATHATYAVSVHRARS